MRLLCITDIHGERSELSNILRHAGCADVILLGGDLTNFGTPAISESLIQVVQSEDAKVMAVAGNCDSAAIDQRLAELGVSLFRRGAMLDDVGFYGVGAMPPWTGTMYELTEEEISAALETGRGQVPGAAHEVVLSHPPPRDTSLDKTRRGSHVGSTAVREFVERIQPALVVCGHIHEARGIDRIGPTTIVNCGPAFNGCYAIAEITDTVKVELHRV